MLNHTKLLAYEGTREQRLSTKACHRRISACANITAAQRCINETNLYITTDELDATPEHNTTRRWRCV